MQKGLVIGLVIVVMAVVAAAGGYFYGVSAGEARANQAGQGLVSPRGAQGAPGAAGQPGLPSAGAPGAAGGRGTVGTVKSVDGTTMQVSTRDSVVTVTLTGQTRVQTQATGSLSDIKVGDNVMVVGSQGSDGAISAQSVQLMGTVPQPGAVPPSGNQ